MMEKIVHTAKQTVKAIVDIDRARPAARSWVEGIVAGLIMYRSIGGVRGAALWLKTKSRRPGLPRPDIRLRRNLIGGFAWRARHWTRSRARNWARYRKSRNRARPSTA
jgi:hypothetical protein